MKHHFKRLVMALAAATALAACVSPQTESAASASVQAGDCAGLVGMQLRAGGIERDYASLKSELKRALKKLSAA